ncbi:MAG: twin-arginine translocase TatA/TatE family subunit [Deltaproteobacteria bacterium]|jgi:sec-independent protein translocase protein TatB|nr:twin-arginine translocase TatA/TatE family subunit [Deltaproteobacteria bacterium]
MNFGIGWSEALLVILVAVLVIKPERLPETARFLGKLWREARRYIRTLTWTLEKEVGDLQNLDTAPSKTAAGSQGAQTAGRPPEKEAPGPEAEGPGPEKWASGGRDEWAESNFSGPVLNRPADYPNYPDPMDPGPEAGRSEPGNRPAAEPGTIRRPNPKTVRRPSPAACRLKNRKAGNRNH